jgi:dienelactone hydrolase
LLLAVVAAAACTRSNSSAGGNGGNGTGGGGDAGGASDLAVGGGADFAGAQPGSDLSTGLLYDTDGPETYTVMSMTATGTNESVPITVYVPSTAGPRPLVVVSSGLQQPAAAYAPYAERLASWGIIAVTRDDPGILGQTATVAGDIAFVVGWLPGQLAGRVDTTRVALAGHSRGGMASLLAAEGALEGTLKGFFGLDPVDNAGMAAAGIGAIAIPSAFLGETTDSGASDCAPAAEDYDVLYNAAPSPSVELTAVGADHTEFEDPANCSFCTLCTKGSADAATVLRYSTRYLMSFCARELLGDTRIDATLNSAADVSAGIVQLHNK